MTIRSLERSRIVHSLLESVEKDCAGSQRDRAKEFGVALGLVNAYLNYCVKKGFVRVKKIPTKRYAYFLTPRGFVEKSRLSVELISSSLHSFRRAREDYGKIFRDLRRVEAVRIALVGISELAEIAILCGRDNDISITQVIDSNYAPAVFLGIPVVDCFSDEAAGLDAAVITNLTEPLTIYRKLVTLLGENRVFAPPILGIGPRREANE